MDTDTRVAIVTGSDSGIGKATAVTLAEAGFDVGVTWRSDEDGAQGTAEEVRAAGRRCAVRQLDLSRLPDTADVIDELADELGGLDVLVNNAGTGMSTPFLDIDYEQWRRCWPSTWTAGSCAGSGLRAGWSTPVAVGGVINVTSVHEHAPRGSGQPRTAAKGGLGLLT